MTPPSWQRPILWLASAALLGAGLGFFAATVYVAWFRLSQGEYHRDTLFQLLSLVALGLVASLAAAWARTRALEALPDRRPETDGARARLWKA